MKEKFTFHIVANLIVYAITLVVNYFMALVLEVESIGIIAFSASFVGLITIFIDLGFSNIYIQRNAEDNFEDYFSIFLTIKSILILGNFIPLFIISFLLNFEPQVFEFLLLKSISQLLFHFCQVFLVNLDSRLKIMKRTIVNFISSIFRQVMIMFIIFNLNLFPKPLIAIGIVYVIFYILELILLLLVSKSEIKLKRINRDLMIKYISATKPLIILVISTQILNNIGNVLLGISFGNEALGKYYFIQNYIMGALLLISGQIVILFGNYFPKEFKSKRLDNIRIMTHKAEKYSSILFLSLIIFSFLNGELVLNIFLPKYSDTVIYLYILIFIPFLAGINRPYLSLIIPSGRQKLYSTYNLTKGILSILLTLFLVPVSIGPIRMLGFGGYGICFISIVFWIIDSIFLRYFAAKIGISSNKRIVYHIFFAIIAFLIAFVVSYLFLRNMISNDIIYLLISATVLFSIYLIELILFKELNREDLVFFFNLLKLSSYKRSLSEELKRNNSNNNNNSNIS